MQNVFLHRLFILAQNKHKYPKIPHDAATGWNPSLLPADQPIVVEAIVGKWFGFVVAGADAYKYAKALAPRSPVLTSMIEHPNPETETFILASRPI